MLMPGEIREILGVQGRKRSRTHELGRTNLPRTLARQHQRSGENGFALLGVAVLLLFGAGVGFALGLPALFIELVLIRALRSRFA